MASWQSLLLNPGDEAHNGSFSISLIQVSPNTYSIFVREVGDDPMLGYTRYNRDGERASVFSYQEVVEKVGNAGMYVVTGKLPPTN